MNAKSCRSLIGRYSDQLPPLSSRSYISCAHLEVHQNQGCVSIPFASCPRSSQWRTSIPTFSYFSGCVTPKAYFISYLLTISPTHFLPQCIVDLTPYALLPDYSLRALPAGSRSERHPTSCCNAIYTYILDTRIITVLSQPNRTCIAIAALA